MNIIHTIFKKIYTWIYGQEPSDFGVQLFQNFLLASGGMGVASIVTFGFNVLGARYMGPTEFGKWNLIGSMAEFLIVVPLFGLATALPRYLGAASEDAKSAIIGSGVRIVLISSVICFPVYWFIQSRLHIIGQTELANTTFVYAIILAFFYLVQSIFQGLKQFRRLSLLWVISALGFVGTVLYYLFVLHNHSYLSLYWGNVIRLGFVVIAGLIVFSPMIWDYSRAKSRELLHFGSFSALSVMAGFFSLGSIDNIMINHYLGTRYVGLYSAYLIAFSIFMSKIIGTFSQVFLPMASGHDSPKQLLKGLIDLAKKTGILLMLGLFVLIWVVFQVYGKGFAFDPRLAIFIAFSNTLYAFLVILGNIILSTGIKGARIGVLFAISSALINVVFNALLIPRFHLYGTVAATVLATLAIIIWAVYYLRSHTDQEVLDKS